MCIVAIFNKSMKMAAEVVSPKRIPDKASPMKAQPNTKFMKDDKVDHI